MTLVPEGTKRIPFPKDYHMIVEILALATGITRRKILSHDLTQDELNDLAEQSQLYKDGHSLYPCRLCHDHKAPRRRDLPKVKCMGVDYDIIRKRKEKQQEDDEKTFRKNYPDWKPHEKRYWD